MNLVEILTEYQSTIPPDGLEVIGSIDGLEATGLSFDSREVQAGNIFFCISGGTHDGHEYVIQAIEHGAVALVVERELMVSVPQIIVEDTREAMGYISCIYFGFPSRELDVVGVTGTNGKTTTTHLIAAILNTAGISCESIGTLTGVLTTPEAPDLQRQFRSMVDGGIKSVVMEVSSHALSKHRVTGTEFDIGVFTNLSQDHLDFHSDIEEYFETKCSLFAAKRCKSAVVNIDDPYGLRLAKQIDIKTHRVSTDAIEIRDEIFTGSSLIWRDLPIELQISGRFNIENALLAASTCLLFGIDENQIVNGLEAAEPVQGRFEVIDGYEGAPTVIVDYSHTPAGIENVLQAVRKISPEVGLTIVFGCGGNRDNSKRPKMARAAEKHADRVIVTSDNPRYEDPLKIIDQTMSGFVDPNSVIVEEDREVAIQLAIQSSNAGEVIVIAGKGAETTQEICGKVKPFDDRVIAEAVLQGVKG